MPTILYLPEVPLTHPPSSLANDVAEILISEYQIQRRVAALGERISTDFAGDEVLFVAVLKGAAAVPGRSHSHIYLPLAIDFMAVSSYGKGTESSGVVRILKDLHNPSTGVMSSSSRTSSTPVHAGLSAAHLHQRHPATLHVCTLQDKCTCREIDVPIDYAGFEVPDAFGGRLRSGLRPKLPPVAVHWGAEAGRSPSTADSGPADGGTADAGRPQDRRPQTA